MTCIALPESANEPYPASRVNRTRRSPSRVPSSSSHEIEDELQHASQARGTRTPGGNAQTSPKAHQRRARPEPAWPPATSLPPPAYPRRCLRCGGVISCSRAEHVRNPPLCRAQFQAPADRVMPTGDEK